MLKPRHEAIMLKILPIILFHNSQNVYPLFSGFSPIIPGKKVIIQHNNNMQTLYVMAHLPLHLRFSLDGGLALVFLFHAISAEVGDLSRSNNDKTFVLGPASGFFTRIPALTIRYSSFCISRKTCTATAIASASTGGFCHVV